METQQDEQIIAEEEGDSISDIISELKSEEDIAVDAESFLAGDENDDEPDTVDTPVREQEEEIYDEVQLEKDSYTRSEVESEITPETDTDEEEVTISDMLENPNLVTPTFGEILIAQHKFSEARHVFVELSKKEPDNTRFIKKIQFLDKFLQAER